MPVIRPVTASRGGSGVVPVTTTEYEELEDKDSGTLYVLTDSEEGGGYYTRDEIDDMLGVIENGSY